MDMFFLLFCLMFSTVAGAPNLVLILTDDQDVMLGGLTPMAKTRQLARNSGVIFRNAFSTTPVCCPARNSLLMGLYQHNHGVSNNSKSGGCSDDTPKANIGYNLENAGYQTFYAGKFLNQYQGLSVPIGWGWWAGLVGNSAYYNYSLNINGIYTNFGYKPEDYLTDVLRKMAVEFIKNNSNSVQPFLMVIAPPAPHEPFTPSEKYKNKYSSVYAPRTPNFNTGTYNKHWLLRQNRFLDKSSIDAVDETFQRRWETLLSVDDLISEVYSWVPKDTLIFVTSDHGFHMGQFSQAWDKRQPYETDIRVPLIVLGPNLPSGAEITNPVLNIDLAPTFYEIGGVPDVDKLKLDGKSFAHLLQKSSPFEDREFFIEYQGEGGGGEYCFKDPNVKLCSYKLNCNCFDARNNSYTCVRNFSRDNNTISCKFYDEESFMELYDLNTDPFQLNNLADKLI